MVCANPVLNPSAIVRSPRYFYCSYPILRKKQCGPGYTVEWIRRRMDLIGQFRVTMSAVIHKKCFTKIIPRNLLIYKDSVQDYEPSGRRFESSWVHHICKRLANWQAFFVLLQKVHSGHPCPSAFFVFGVGTRPFGLPVTKQSFAPQ